MPAHSADSSRPTLESVARMADVSRQTVSNAVNAPHLVRADTLERVRSVIAEVGYRPHRAARTLRTRRSHLIAVPLPPAVGTSTVLDRFLHELTVQAQAHDNRVLLFAAQDDAAEIAGYGELIDDHDVDAFVLTGTHLDDRRTEWLAQRRAVFVTFGRPWGAQAHHGWVDVDGAAGTAEATEVLLLQGHRRIAFLGWPAGSGVGDDRHGGYRAACAAAGALDPRLERFGQDDLAAGRALAADLLDLQDPPTAIVCVSDTLAIGAWTELNSRALRIGEDVALIGFDDTPTASVIGLSSVAQPLREAAAACTAMLDDVLTGPDLNTPPNPVLLQPSLVLRTSSGGHP